MKNLLHLIVFFFILLAGACGGGGSGGATPPETPPANPPINNPTAQRGDLVSTTVLTNYTASEISNSGQNYLNVVAIYGVNNYSITYKTVDTDGNIINVSGLLSIPAKDPAAASPMLVYNHGTIFLDTEAPSRNLNSNLLGPMLASQDYVVLMPDYIGYGESAQLMHPYVHASTLATTNIDMIRAVKTWLSQELIPAHNQLFISGYSEGGYATMATHKEIQTNYADEFTVTASMPAGGPYDMSETANFFINQADLGFASYVVYVFKAYDTIYNDDRIAEIFQPAYVDTVNNSFDGTNNAAAIESSLTTMTIDLFTSQFLTDFKGTGETDIKARLAENDIFDWKPVNPVHIYHGSGDTIVPTANATTAHAAITANGGNVSLGMCSNGAGNHGDCGLPYLNAMLTYFGSL